MKPSQRNTVLTKKMARFDLEASARKLADGQANLEKRLGAGDLPPKSAEEYALELPDRTSTLKRLRVSLKCRPCLSQAMKQG